MRQTRQTNIYVLSGIRTRDTSIKRRQTYALEGAATGIGSLFLIKIQLILIATCFRRKGLQSGDKVCSLDSSSSSSSSIGTTTLSWVSACSTVVEHSQLEVPLPAARQNPNMEENQGFRAFQLSPQEAPSVWSDASEPSSGMWNYGRENGREF
jgi:hypothetical protein